MITLFKIKTDAGKNLFGVSHAIKDEVNSKENRQDSKTNKNYWNN